MSGTVTLTRAQHKERIRANVLAFVTAPPPGWELWGVERARNFKRACEDLHKAPSLPKLLGAAKTLADMYGRSMAEIDPLHGQQ